MNEMARAAAFAVEHAPKLHPAGEAHLSKRPEGEPLAGRDR